MFDGDVFTIEDQRFEYDETRYITFGLLKFRVIVVAHTDEEDVIRIISARKATKMKKNITSKKSGTDLKRLDTMADADIDFSDIPEVTPEMFAKGVVRRGLQPITKRQLTLRLDSDVIEWFKTQGSGYQTKMNALLRAYMQEHEKAADSRTRGVTRRG